MKPTILLALALSLTALLSAADAPTLSELERTQALLKWTTLKAAEAGLEAAQLKVQIAQSDWQSWVKAHERPGYQLEPDLTYQAVPPPDKP